MGAERCTHSRFIATTFGQREWAYRGQVAYIMAGDEDNTKVDMNFELPATQSLPNQSSVQLTGPNK
jgi:hypothetical protein